jgi:hypothetical protein
MSVTNHGDDKSLIQIAFPQQANVIFWSATILGLALIGLPTIFRSHFALNGTQSNLVVCLGAALVLSAFGGQATVKIGSVIMAGVAAVAFGLFVYLQNSSSSLFLKGSVHAFDYNKYEALEMIQTNRLLGRITQNNANPQRSRYDFVLFKEELDGQTIEISLTRRDTKTEQLLLVDVGELASAFGERTRLEWELREVKAEPEEVEQEQVVTLWRRFPEKEIAREKVVGVQGAAANRTGWVLIRPAFAQGVLGKIDVALMLERLKSDDTATRRDARAALAKAPIESVPKIMQAFREQFGDYRVKLGICVALTEMLRADKKRASALRSRLTDDDIAPLVSAAGDSDRTVRVYATEFLVDLGDRRSTTLAIQQAAATSDDNARYNWLLVGQSAWGELEKAEKKDLADILAQARQKSGPKTKALFDKFGGT